MSDPIQGLRTHILGHLGMVGHSLPTAAEFQRLWVWGFG